MKSRLNPGCQPAVDMFHLNLFIFLSFAFPIVQTRIIFEKPAVRNVNPGWPGVKIRLTMRGAEEVKNVAVRLLNREIPRLKGYSFQHSFSDSGIQGTVFITDLKVLRYSPPSVDSLQLVSPSYVVLELQNMDIVLTGRFVSYVGLMVITGSITSQIEHMSVKVVTSFKTTSDGLMQVKVIDCSNQIFRSHLSIDADGPLNGLIKTLELHINEVVRQKMPVLFCNGLTRIIEGNSSRLFQKLSRIDLSEPFRTIGPIENPVIEQLIRRFTKGLYIDNRNIADPRITSDFIETQQIGEIRYAEDPRRTPFFPPPMQVTNESTKMLYLFGSEYLFNSLLYHAYEGDKLMVEINEDTLPVRYRGLVRTTCNNTTEDIISSMCLGKLIPEIAKSYPNSTASFTLLPHGMPLFHLADGIGSFDLKTRLIAYIDGIKRRQQVLVSSADLQADLRFIIENYKFIAILKLNKFTARLHRSAVKGVNSDTITQLTPLAKTFIGPYLAKALKKGIPFPLKDSIEFINPELVIKDGYAQLATDFRLSEEGVRKKVIEAFSSSFPIN